MDLYEQIFYELLEIREMYTANELLMQCDPLVMMKTEKEERWGVLFTKRAGIFRWSTG